MASILIEILFTQQTQVPSLMSTQTAMLCENVGQDNTSKSWMQTKTNSLAKSSLQHFNMREVKQQDYRL